MKPRYLSVLFPAVFLACNSLMTESIESIEQDYLFEVEYVNHAWGTAWNGLVIESNGDVYTYNIGQEDWAPSSSETFTEAELKEKYNHQSQYVGRIDAATIVQQFSRISSVGDDHSDPEQLCADAGGLSYRAFRYDSTTGLYHPLLLRVEGDFAKQNSSNAAEDLAEWLRSLLSTMEDVGVTPFTEGTCTP